MKFRGVSLNEIQKGVKRAAVLDALGRAAEALEKHERDWWSRRRFIKASELRPDVVIVEQTGRRSKTYTVTHVEPPHGRLDRSVRVEIRGGAQWSFHCNDEVMVQA